MSAEILEKLNKMHTDIKLTNERLQNVVGDVHDHEIILRGESKVNGLVSEVKELKVSQSTAHRLWVGMVTLAGTVIAWMGLK